MRLPALLLASAPVVPLSAPDAEIVVVGEREVLVARDAVGSALSAFGYGEGRERDGVVTYRSPNGWYPDVHLHPHGTVQHRWPVRRRLALIVFGDFRKAKNRRGDIVRAIHPEVFAWREALAAEAMGRRYRALPDQLALLWVAGIPLDETGPLVRTPEARRAALLDFWSSRTCTPEGQRVRDLTADFLGAVVQGSAWPVTDEEARGAAARTPCGDGLEFSR